MILVCANSVIILSCYIDHIIKYFYQSAQPITRDFGRMSTLPAGTLNALRVRI